MLGAFFRYFTMKLFITQVLGCALLSTILAEEDVACGGKPADVVFLLDSSASIGPSDFQKQLKFTQDVVRLFDIGSDRTRVGVVLFSDSIEPVIDLFHYNDKRTLISAIGKLQYISGGTNTGEALLYIVDKIYNKDKRDGVPKIAIVLTDGQSHDKATTIQEATRAHAAGISIFVIGIGFNTDESELKAIASDPDGDFLLQIESYSALERFKEVLAIKACEVEYVQPQQTFMDSSGPGSCHLRVLFGADTSGMSTGSSLDVSSFFSDVIETIPAIIGNVRTSQIMSDCPGKGGTVNKTYAPLLRKMRLQAAGVKQGNAQENFVGVLVVDNMIADFSATIREVMRSSFQDFKLFIVAVNDANLSQIALLFRTRVYSSKFNEHVFKADSTENLQSFVSQISDALTKQCFE